MLDEKILQRYLELKDYIKVLSEEQDTLKQLIKRSHVPETKHYIINVKKHNRTYITNTESLIQVVGIETMKQFLKTSEIITIEVLRKPGV